MKHILKLMALICAVSACWLGLLETSIVPRTYTWLLPVYFVVSLGCYGLLMVGIGLILFPTCPEEAFLLQKCNGNARISNLAQETESSSNSSMETFIAGCVYHDLFALIFFIRQLLPSFSSIQHNTDIAEAKEFLKGRGIDVGSD